MNATVDEILPARNKEELKRLELLARKTIDGLLHGLHESQRHGVSAEFDHHKPFQPGDALRHIDWRVSARHDEFFVKRYHEDTSLSVHLLLDASGSMLSASGVHTKVSHAISLAACLVYLVIKQNDRLAVVAMSEGECLQSPLGSSGPHMVAVLDALLAHAARGEDDLVRHLGALLHQNSPRGLVVFISDLLYDPQPVQSQLAQLHHQGHEIIVVNVRDRHEELFPFNQWVRFVDLEQRHGPVKVDTVVLRRFYLEEYQAVMAEWQTWSKGQDIHFITSHSHEGAETTVLRYFDYRRRIGRR